MFVSYKRPSAICQKERLDKGGCTGVGRRLARLILIILQDEVDSMCSKQRKRKEWPIEGERSVWKSKAALSVDRHRKATRRRQR